MKKNGFTLAEVLITLTIIGVIATMTLPALMTNTQEQQAVTGLKKGINTLTDMAQMNQAIEGYDYVGLVSDNFGTPDVNRRSLYSLIANRASVDLQSSTAALDGITPPAMTVNYAIPGGAPTAIIYLRDGSAILYRPGSTSVAGNAAIGQAAADGAPQGFTVIYDTNGKKGPNVLSNCAGNAQGAVDADNRYNVVAAGGAAVANADITQTCTANNGRDRVIKDQFQVQLRGAYAVPRGAASQWAYNK